MHIGEKSGGTSNRQQRITSFRARHRIGQIVRGRVVGRDPEGLHWINIHGDELLVDLGGPVPEGSVHTFRIESLDPVVVLKHMKDAPVSWPGPLHSVAALFAEHKRGYAQSVAALPKGHPEVQAGCAHMLELEAHINLKLFEDKPGFFRWLPDLFAETGGAECLAIPAGNPPPDATAPRLWQIVIDFEPAPGRHGQARLLLKYPRTSYRILLDNPKDYPMVGRVHKLASTLLPDMEVNCLGILPMHGKTTKIMQYFLSPQPSLNTFFSSSI